MNELEIVSLSTELQRLQAENDQLKKQLEQRTKELACAQENFRVTNEAYIKSDKMCAEMRPALLTTIELLKKYGGVILHEEAERLKVLTT